MTTSDMFLLPEGVTMIDLIKENYCFIEGVDCISVVTAAEKADRCVVLIVNRSKINGRGGSTVVAQSNPGSCIQVLRDVLQHSQKIVAEKLRINYDDKRREEAPAVESSIINPGRYNSLPAIPDGLQDSMHGDANEKQLIRDPNAAQLVLEVSGGIHKFPLTGEISKKAVHSAAKNACQRSFRKEGVSWMVRLEAIQNGKNSIGTIGRKDFDSIVAMVSAGEDDRLEFHFLCIELQDRNGIARDRV